VSGEFSGWLEGAKFYGPLLAAGIILLLVLRQTPYVWLSVPFLLLGVGVLLFFRDFPRTISAAEHEVVAPADGKVVAVEILEDSPYFEGKTKRISIFLSLFDAHINRAPYQCRVREIEYKPGKFINAMKPDSSTINEANTLYLDTELGPMTVRQISGLVARRIVCAASVGDSLSTGQKFGMIRFGSRTELYLPPRAEVMVEVDDKVHAGSSIVARFSES